MIQVIIVYIASNQVALLMTVIIYIVSVPELKDRHAGWKNPCTKRRKTKRSNAEMLEVTKCMGT